jgi:peroxiredoxin Q/BCP
LENFAGAVTVRGMKFPAFSLPASDGKNYSEADFKSGKFVLYVYPKDMTSGCTRESQDFRDAASDFEKLGFRILGLSKDSIKSHEKFCQKESLNFPLLSDEKFELLNALGAWVEKSMYGRTYFGADRSTFVIVDGKIIREWRKVKVPEHVTEVLDFCRGL